MNFEIKNDSGRLYLFLNSEQTTGFFIDPVTAGSGYVTRGWRSQISWLGYKELPKGAEKALESIQGLDRARSGFWSKLKPTELVGKFLVAFSDETRRRDIQLTEFQVRAAHAMADAHYHRWAQKREVTFYLGNPLQVGWLEDHPHPYEELEIRGIDFPYVVALPSGEGMVVHETGTGRVTWMIYSDGLTIQVNRPGGNAITVAVDPSGEVAINFDCDGETVTFAGRHVAALNRCLNALQGVGLCEPKARQEIEQAINACDLFEGYEEE